ncbi:MAG: hypothetical protein HYX94_03760 [Chloroflexi bacterium]|nr:hypothetical protein [Chloroflexota bacterium]
MIIVNFAHPLDQKQIRQLEEIGGATVERVIEVDSQVDPAQPLAPQVAALVDEVDLSARDWQSIPLIVNLPSLNHSAAVVLAELHGRCGYFPAILRLRPTNSFPAQFEVAEVISLQHLRDGARRKRV